MWRKTMFNSLLKWFLNFEEFKEFDR